MVRCKVLTQVIALIAVTIWLLSCSRTADDTPIKVSHDELKRMILLLEPTFDSTSNFHIVFTEKFNDVTQVVQIVQSPLPREKSTAASAYESFRYRGSEVFVYLPPTSNSASSVSLPSPFWLVHAPQWEVLLQREDGRLTYRKLCYLSPYDESLPDTLLNVF